MDWEANRKELVYALADTHRATIQTTIGKTRAAGTLYWPGGSTFTAWGESEDEVLDRLAEEIFRVSHERRTASA